MNIVNRPWFGSFQRRDGKWSYFTPQGFTYVNMAMRRSAMVFTIRTGRTVLDDFDGFVVK